MRYYSYDIQKMVSESVFLMGLLMSSLSIIHNQLSMLKCLCHFCCSSWLFRSQFRSLQLLYINQSVFLIALSAIMLNKNELPLVLRSIHGHCKSYGQENNNRCGKYWPLTDLLPLYLFNCRYCYHNLLQPDENRVERLAVLLCYGSLIFCHTIQSQ